MWSKTYKMAVLIGLAAMIAFTACKKSDDTVYPQANESVYNNGNSVQRLNEPQNNETRGIITGTVLPADAMPMVKVIQLDQVFAVTPDANGNFSISVPQGNYTVTATSMAGTYKDAAMGTVQVKNGTATSVGTVILSKQ